MPASFLQETLSHATSCGFACDNAVIAFSQYRHYISHYFRPDDGPGQPYGGAWNVSRWKALPAMMVVLPPEGFRLLTKVTMLALVGVVARVAPPTAS